MKYSIQENKTQQCLSNSNSGCEINLIGATNILKNNIDLSRKYQAASYLVRVSAVLLNFCLIARVCLHVCNV